MAYGAPPLFRQGVSIRARFLFFLMLSLAVILVDGRLRALDDFRSALTSFLTPFKEVVQLPGLFIEKSQRRNSTLNERESITSIGCSSHGGNATRK